MMNITTANYKDSWERCVPEFTTKTVSAFFAKNHQTETPTKKNSFFTQ